MASTQSLPPLPIEQHNGGPSVIKKQESASPTDQQKVEEKPAKPHKPLNRVPRACNACRKQKMRCEGADNPPCKRCRHSNLECLFEKPNRETTLTSEAGMERMRAVEDRVRSVEEKMSSLQHGVTTIQNTLTDLVSHLRGTTPAYVSQQQQQHNSSSPYIYHRLEPSPGNSSHSGGGAGPPTPTERDLVGQALSLPRSGRAQLSPIEPRRPQPQGSNNAYHRLAAPRGLSSPPEQSYIPQTPYMTQSNPIPSAYPTLPPMYGSTSLPPISQMGMGPPPLPPRQAIPPLRNHPPQAAEISSHLRSKLPDGVLQPSHRIRTQPPSNVTSAESSDDEGALLTAPLETLRRIGASIENPRQDGHHSSTTSEARTRSHSPQLPERGERPYKRRKTHHSAETKLKHEFPDVVTKGIVTEDEARSLFGIFYEGCSTFLSVFDEAVDTFDSLHKRSPFAVNCICMVAAKVRDGGGPPSDVYLKCLEEVQNICSQTLFSPVTSSEAVRAVLILAGWSTNGWLSGGHAVRMALEYGMHRAWPKLMKRLKTRTIPQDDEKELVISVRTWLCLFLFEHQLSYGTGRPAILREDDSIKDCRLFLQHPYSVVDDMRLVSTVELMVLREKVQNLLAPLDGPVEEHVFRVLEDARQEFKTWFDFWDAQFSQKHTDATFYRQSLQIQHHFAELFHNATALRGIKGPGDVAKIPEAQRSIAVKSIECATAGLGICLRSPSYREGLKYAVHYTHVTATFAGVLLTRLTRLFPDECEHAGGIRTILSDVEDLVEVLSTIPAGRYAQTLRILLEAAMKNKNLPLRSIVLNAESSSHHHRHRQNHNYQQQQPQQTQHQHHPQPQPQHQQSQPQPQPQLQQPQPQPQPQLQQPQLQQTQLQQTQLQQTQLQQTQLQQTQLQQTQPQLQQLQLQPQPQPQPQQSQPQSQPLLQQPQHQHQHQHQAHQQHPQHQQHQQHPQHQQHQQHPQHQQHQQHQQHPAHQSYPRHQIPQELDRSHSISSSSSSVHGVPSGHPHIPPQPKLFVSPQAHPDSPTNYLLSPAAAAGHFIQMGGMPPMAVYGDSMVVPHQYIRQDMPAWTSESSLGDLSQLSQGGLEAFIMPFDQPTVPQIW